MNKDELLLQYIDTEDSFEDSQLHDSLELKFIKQPKQQTRSSDMKYDSEQLRWISTQQPTDEDVFAQIADIDEIKVKVQKEDSFELSDTLKQKLYASEVEYERIYANLLYEVRHFFPDCATKAPITTDLSEKVLIFLSL